MTTTLILDGKAGYLTLPPITPDQLDLRRGLTIQAWVQPDGLWSGRPIIALGGTITTSSTPGHTGVRIPNTLILTTRDAGKVAFGIAEDIERATSSRVLVDKALVEGAWTHITAVLDRYGAGSIYVNGKLAMQAQLEGIPAIIRDQCFAGTDGSRSAFFKGQLAEVRIWSIALTPDEIAASFAARATGKERDLLACHPLDAIDAGYARDISSSARHAKAEGGAKTASSDLTFEPAKERAAAISLAGGSITLPPLSLDMAKGATFQAWIRARAGRDLQPILEMSPRADDKNPSVEGISLGVNTDDDALSLVVSEPAGKTASTISLAGVAPAGAWVHVTATVAPDGQTTLYTNGAPRLTRPAPPPRSGERAFAAIGSSARSRATWQGDLAEVRVYRRCLSESEVASGWCVRADGSEADLLAAWPLDRVDQGGAHDVGPNGYNGTIKGTVAVVSDGPRTPAPGTSSAAAPRCATFAAGSVLELPPIAAKLSAGVTLQAWANFRDPKAALCVIELGSSSGETISLAQATPAADAPADRATITLAITQDGKKTVLEAPNAALIASWVHLSATIDGAGNAAIWLDGKSLVSGKLPVPAELQEGEVRDRCTIGRNALKNDKIKRTTTSAGDVAEVRIWSRVLGRSEIIAGFCRRVSGGEDGLEGCWRLDDVWTRVAQDMSSERLHGRYKSVSSGVASMMPLTPVEVSADISGELISEAMFTAQGRSDRSTYQIEITVFDAKNAPVRGAALQILADEDATLVVQAGEAASNMAWRAGDPLCVKTSGTGRARLILLAGSNLRCPDLRMRLAGSPPDAWIVVRADSAAWARLSTAKGDALRAAPSGKRPFLDSSVSAADADAIATTLRGLGGVAVAAVPKAQRLIGVGLATPGITTKGIFDSVAGAIGDAIDAGEDAIIDPITKGAEDLYRVASGGVEALAKKLDKVATRAAKGASGFLVSTGDAASKLLGSALTMPAIEMNASSMLCIANARQLMIDVGGQVVSGGKPIFGAIQAIGTVMLDGVEHVFRVVMRTAKQAWSAVVSFCQRIGKAVEDLIDYLTTLLDWAKIQKAGERIYADMEKSIKQLAAPDLGMLADPFGSGIDLAALGDRALREDIGIPSVSVKMPSKEFSWFLDQVEKGLSALDFDVKLPELSSVTLPDITPDQIDKAMEGVLAAVPKGLFDNPEGLLDIRTRDLAAFPVAIINGVQPLWNALLGYVEQALKLGIEAVQTALTARWRIPAVGRVIEEIVFGGKPLNLLRVIAYAAAIMEVIGDAAAKAGKSTAASFGDDTGDADDTEDTGDAHQPSSYIQQGASVADLIGSCLSIVASTLEVGAYYAEKDSTGVEIAATVLAIVAAATSVVTGSFYLAGADGEPTAAKKDLTKTQGSLMVIDGAIGLMVEGYTLNNLLLKKAGKKMKSTLPTKIGGFIGLMMGLAEFFMGIVYLDIYKQSTTKEQAATGLSMVARPVVIGVQTFANRTVDVLGTKEERTKLNPSGSDSTVEGAAEAATTTAPTASPRKYEFEVVALMAVRSLCPGCLLGIDVTSLSLST